MATKRSRMRRPYLPRFVRVTLALLITASVFVVTLQFHYGADTALGVAGLLFGVIAFILSELQDREGSIKSIWYIGQEDAIFNDNILKGLTRTLGDVPRKALGESFPPRGESDRVAWQVTLLCSREAESYDAVVILPAADDRRIWDALVRLRREGLTLVVIDIAPPVDIFLDQDLEPPVFVSSDFAAGGQLAGSIVEDALRADTDAFAVVAIGPSWSPPGIARSAQLLYCLAQARLLSRVDILELESWDVVAASAGLERAINDRLGYQPTSCRAVVFCGNDSVMAAVTRMAAARPEWSGLVQVVGYDGTTDSSGNHLAQQEEAWCIGTIDTRPLQQGVEAGRALVEAYNGRAGPSDAVASCRLVRWSHRTGANVGNRAPTVHVHPGLGEATVWRRWSGGG